MYTQRGYTHVIHQGGYTQGGIYHCYTPGKLYPGHIPTYTPGRLYPGRYTYIYTREAIPRVEYLLIYTREAIPGGNLSYTPGRLYPGWVGVPQGVQNGYGRRVYFRVYIGGFSFSGPLGGVYTEV